MEKDSVKSSKPIGNQVLHGSAWTIAMRWVIRLIGLINTAIIARILIPADFGLIALVMIVVGFVEMFAELGVDLALIRRTDASRLHFDTAWTLRIITSVLLALIIFSIAPFSAEYFSDQRVTLLIQVMALKPLIAGFENIGIVDFRKDMEFSKDFTFNVLSRFISFFISVTLAIILRSYWALAISIIAQQVISTILSYIIHPYRPSFSLGAFTEIGSISIWLLIRSLGYALLDKVDQLVVGKILGTSALGEYFVAKSIANMLTLEILLPIGRVLLPGYAKLVHLPERLFKAFLKVTGIIATISIAFGFGLMVVAPDLVAVLLGPKWYGNIPLLEIFAFSGAFYGITSIIGPFMVAIGQVRIIALFGWIQFIVLALVLWFVSSLSNIIWIAWANAIILVIFTFINLQIVCSLINQNVRLFLSALLRPVLSGIIMVIVIKALHINALLLPIFALILNIAIGGLTYISVILILWRLAGRPDGPEREILERLSMYTGRKILIF